MVCLFMIHLSKDCLLGEWDSLRFHHWGFYVCIPALLSLAFDCQAAFSVWSDGLACYSNEFWIDVALVFQSIELPSKSKRVILCHTHHSCLVWVLLGWRMRGRGPSLGFSLTFKVGRTNGSGGCICVLVSCDIG